MREYKASQLFQSQEHFFIQKIQSSQAEAPHTHDFIELVYILSGSGVQSVDGQSFAVRRGDMMFLSYRQVHAFTVETPLEYVNILLNPAFLSGQLVNDGNAYAWLTMAVFDDFGTRSTPASPRIRLTVDAMVEVEGIIAHMLREYGQREAGWQSVLKGYLEVLLAKMIRAMDNIPDKRLSMALLPEVLSYIDEHLGEKITLCTLAERCFYNPAYFSRLFKETCGMTLTEYLTGRRMAQAAKLLEDSTLTVDQVAQRVGYGDHKQFYAAFHQYAGIAPGKWRAEREKGKNPPQTG